MYSWKIKVVKEGKKPNIEEKFRHLLLSFYFLIRLIAISFPLSLNSRRRCVSSFFVHPTHFLPDGDGISELLFSNYLSIYIFTMYIHIYQMKTLVHYLLLYFFIFRFQVQYTSRTMIAQDLIHFFIFTIYKYFLFLISP